MRRSLANAGALPPPCRPRRTARRRAMDLTIAATANVAGVPPITHHVADFQLVAELVDVGAAG